ncbi:MAG TPA: phosphatidate cytidylyltransferase [Methanothermobacter sp.]|jgi:dolichol kinase|uniref:Phosphatidate cytidylyltransferase n=1 Tax=Methanothermobacter tenebrarum TaxID=680118 RepID=A0ABM7YCJ6_9EURY|nr:diacylglycerol/polyprenol kinase family protein [Methanothermobacter tenebrarum]MDD3455152.1 SEC59/DGK1/VTE5 family protein [Methanobacteriales archaeon]MDX9693796.1 SEC59/DGK1/VTE5 family protein [Methanothermobacter sp.]BDH78934.1 phosphatidate cytidylyltransferase [Methanothermobacter tenebrarum]HHW17141.1 phosphatidate cytidylyltransferase [Methanothermobacter sp.]HOQ19591.1 SEC59/DGK1/VTE5 family protein [Methanothermobacter sp.]
MNDIIGLLLVYGYVAILLFIADKFQDLNISRKFVHIMVGNIIFILPVFKSWWVMTLLAAAPFIPLTFLISPYSPLKIEHKVSSYGHSLGLVYYSISWTLLALLFFDHPWIIAIGIAAMSYGDGLASLIGEKYGKRKYNILGDPKSVEGSLAMFITLLITLPLVLFYYQKPVTWPIIFAIAATATIIEGATPKGLDNITASAGAVAVYLLI